GGASPLWFPRRRVQKPFDTDARASGTRAFPSAWSAKCRRKCRGERIAVVVVYVPLADARRCHLVVCLFTKTTATPISVCSPVADTRCLPTHALPARSEERR